MRWYKKLGLGFKMFLNCRHIPVGTSYQAHLAIALKLLEIPPEIKGVVVECGTWKGGSATNLSLVCKIVNRRLLIFDSFKGLPSNKEGYVTGDYNGTLKEVKTNIYKYGNLECCSFKEGWFKNTLPEVKEPIVLAFLDVDLKESLETCVKYLWNNIVEGGYLFTDESIGLDYVSLFFNEKWWLDNFNFPPPMLIGAGTGLPLGNYYIGSWEERKNYPRHSSSGIGYTRKKL
jgi:hypothetical protein